MSSISDSGVSLQRGLIRQRVFRTSTQNLTAARYATSNQCRNGRYVKHGLV